jgi:hypothetical protein
LRIRAAEEDVDRRDGGQIPLMNAAALSGKLVNRMGLEAVGLECIEPRVGRDPCPRQVRGAELNRQIQTLAHDSRHSGEDVEFGSLDVDLDDIDALARFIGRRELRL